MISLLAPARCGDNGGNHIHPEKRAVWTDRELRTGHPAGGQCHCMVSGGTHLGTNTSRRRGKSFCSVGQTFQSAVASGKHKGLPHDEKSISLQPTSFLYHVFFFNDPATPEIYTLSLHDALPI